jgi:tetratricopeptide (TPR) repeat protein
MRAREERRPSGAPGADGGRAARRARGAARRDPTLLAAAFALLGAIAAVAPCRALPWAQVAEAQRRPPRDPREAQARALFEQGQAAYEEGRYEEAINAFEQAHALSARPLLLYNIANAQERLGLLREALENLRYYLEDAPADERPVLERRIRGLEDRVRRQQAEEARRQEEQQRVAEAAARAAVAQVGAGRMQGPIHAGPKPPVLGYTLVGLGGAAVVTGVVFGVLALGARADAAEGCTEAGGATLCTAATRDALSTDTTFSLLADVGVIAGVALAAVGVYLVVTHDDGTADSAPADGAAAREELRAAGSGTFAARARAASRPRAEVGLGGAPGGASLVVRGRF